MGQHRKPQRPPLTAAERNARARASGRASLVWDAEFDNGPDMPRGAGVRPDVHEASAYSYSLTRCAHCRPAHNLSNRLRKVAGHDTDVLSLTSLRRTDLVAAAARHLADRARAVTIPPPPAPLPPRRHSHQRTR